MEEEKVCFLFILCNSPVSNLPIYSLGAKILGWTYHGGDNQKWDFTADGIVTSKKNGLFLDIAEADKGAGAGLVLAEKSDQQSQKWKQVATEARLGLRLPIHFPGISSALVN